MTIWQLKQGGRVSSDKVVLASTSRANQGSVVESSAALTRDRNSTGKPSTAVPASTNCHQQGTAISQSSAALLNGPVAGTRRAAGSGGSLPASAARASTGPQEPEIATTGIIDTYISKDSLKAAICAAGSACRWVLNYTLELKLQYIIFLGLLI